MNLIQYIVGMLGSPSNTRKTFRKGEVPHDSVKKNSAKNRQSGPKTLFFAPFHIFVALFGLFYDLSSMFNLI